MTPPGRGSDWGHCFLQLGRLDEAEVAIKRAIQGYDPDKYSPIPGFPQVLLMRRYLALPDLYEVYAAANQRELAIMQFERIRAAHAELEIPATYWLAKSPQAAREHERAAGEYEKYVSYGAGKAFDYRTKAMLEAGICYWSAGRKPEAQAQWKKLTDEEPRFPEAGEARRLLREAGVEVEEPAPLPE